MKYTKEKEDQIIEACQKELSMRQASIVLKMNYKTLVKQAKRLGCFKTNQSGKGINKKPPRKYILDDILNGEYPGYGSFKLKNRLLKEGLKEHKCEFCKGEYWLLKPIPLELHHKDGDRLNNSLNNLELLCPNCHSFTDNYRAKNIKK